MRESGNYANNEVVDSNGEDCILIIAQLKNRTY